MRRAVPGFAEGAVAFKIVYRTIFPEAGDVLLDLRPQIFTFGKLGESDRHLNPNSVYRRYAIETGISEQVIGLWVHSLRATAATNALSHDCDIAKVQEWSGHANVSTTHLNDRRKSTPEDSPTFRVKY